MFIFFIYYRYFSFFYVVYIFTIYKKYLKVNLNYYYKMINNKGIDGKHLNKLGEAFKKEGFFVTKSFLNIQFFSIGGNLYDVVKKDGNFVVKDELGNKICSKKLNPTSDNRRYFKLRDDISMVIEKYEIDNSLSIIDEYKAA